MKKEIDLGYVHIGSWKNTNKTLFQDWMVIEYPKRVQSKDNQPNSPALEGNQSYRLIIDYPLRTEHIQKFKTGPGGMTKRELVNLIVKAYKYVYYMENRTSKVKEDKIVAHGNMGMYSRTSTEGKFGIWGHGINDLMLSCAHIDENNDITLGIDS